MQFAPIEVCPIRCTWLISLQFGPIATFAPLLERNYVRTDNTAGGLQATRHLLRLGRKRIAYLAFADTSGSSVSPRSSSRAASSRSRCSAAKSSNITGK